MAICDVLSSLSQGLSEVSPCIDCLTLRLVKNSTVGNGNLVRASPESVVYPGKHVSCRQPAAPWTRRTRRHARIQYARNPNAPTTTRSLFCRFKPRYAALEFSLAPSPWKLENLICEVRRLRQDAGPSSNDLLWSVVLRTSQALIK